MLPLSESNKSQENHDDSLVVSLTPKSRLFLKKYLEKNDMSGYDGNNIFLKIAPNANDNYVYEPIIGERMVFRMKGLIKSDTGIVVRKYIF